MIGTSVFVGTNNVKRNSKTFLLDQPFATGATAAYSLRKLKSSATKAVRVREDSGNTEIDIGFSGGTLDETALLNHCGSNNGFVTKWYDQSGNGNDASNSTASQQPQIVDNGSVITENGKPAIRFNDNELTRSSLSTSSKDYSLFTVINLDNITGNSSGQYVVDSFTRRLVFAPIGFTSNKVGLFDGTWRETSETTADQQILTWIAESSAGTFENFKNGGSIGSETYSGKTMGGTFKIGRSVGGRNFIKGKVQEIILYNSDESSNRKNIETNINGHYSIF